MKEPLTLKLIRVLFPLIGGCALIGALFPIAQSFSRTGSDRQDLLVLALAVGLFGLVFLIVGLVMYKIGRGPSKKQLALLETGQRVTARITDLRWDESISVNGRHPCRLYCEYEEGGVVYRCRSQYLWSMPAIDQDQEYVSVYRDPNDYTQYLVDVESILRPVVEL